MVPAALRVIFEYLITLDVPEEVKLGAAIFQRGRFEQNLTTTYRPFIIQTETLT